MIARSIAQPIARSVIQPIIGGVSQTPAAFLSHVLIRAKGADFSGSSLVGEGATFTSTTTNPVVVGNALRFDGVENEIAATLSTTFDLNNKTVLMAAKVAGVASSGDGIFKLGGAFDEIVIRAGNAAEFYGQLRSDTGTGFGSITTVVADSNNVLHDLVASDVVFMIKVSAAEALAAHGEFSVGITTNSHDNTVTSIVLGSGRNLQRPPMDIYEFMVLDTADQDIAASAVEYLRTTYAATGPYVTPMLAKEITNLGDSIASGVGSSTGTLAFRKLLSKSFGAVSSNQATAGAQVSPVNLISPDDDAKIAACFSNITSTSIPFLGIPVATLFAGVNDYNNGSGVPIGTLFDATDTTFFGALNVGWTNFLTNSDPGTPLFIFTPIHKTDETANAAGHTLEEYRAAIRSFVVAKNHPLLALVEMSGSGIVDADLPDGLHPNDAGHAKIKAKAEPQIAAYYGVVR